MRVEIYSVINTISIRFDVDLNSYNIKMTDIKTAGALTVVPLAEIE